jgi:carbonic anhydrase
VPEQFLGPNSLVAVFRNAGGRYTPDVVRTIATLQSLGYQSESTTVMVVHHTGRQRNPVAWSELTLQDCGMTHLTSEGIKDDVRKRDTEGKMDTSHINFGCFPKEDLEKSIHEDVAALKADPLVAGVEVRGFVLTTETGLLREV